MQHQRLVGRREKLISDFAMTPRQLSAYVLPVFAIAGAGFHGRTNQHVRHSAHGRNHHYEVGVLSMLGHYLAHILHPLGVPYRSAAELHDQERFLAFCRSRRFFNHNSSLACHENSSPPQRRRGLGGGGYQNQRSSQPPPDPLLYQGGGTPGAL